MTNNSQLAAPTGRAFAHPALFYWGITDYLAATVPFIRDGLATGQPTAVAVPGHNLTALREALGTAGSDVHWLDMTEVGRNPGRIIPGVLRAFADRHAGRTVRIIGEPIWPGRTGTEYPACVQHEALINLAFSGHTATILCPYDAENLDEQVIADAAATHPLLKRSTGTQHSDDYQPERVLADYNQPLPPPDSMTALTVDATNLTEARAATTRHATHGGLSAERAEDLTLAINELVTNSIEHAHGHATLRYWLEPGNVVCEVQDSGHISDPLAGRLPASREQLRGRGLLLVNQLADLVRTHSAYGTTTTRIYFAANRTC